MPPPEREAALGVNVYEVAGRGPVLIFRVACPVCNRAFHTESGAASLDEVYASLDRYRAIADPPACCGLRLRWPARPSPPPHLRPIR